MLNVLFKRLFDEFENPRDAAPIKAVINEVALKSQGLPLPERLAPRPTKPGTLDLTAANLLVGDFEMHARVVNCVKTIDRVIKIGNSGLYLSSAIEALFRFIHGLHSFWRQKSLLSPSDRQKYRVLAERFGMVWRGLQWAVSTWVHWNQASFFCGCFDSNARVRT